MLATVSAWVGIRSLSYRLEDLVSERASVSSDPSWQVPTVYMMEVAHREMFVVDVEPPAHAQRATGE